jgi:hypothetical protein
VVLLLAAAIMAAGCADPREPAAATSHPASDTPSTTDDVAEQIGIYAAVISRLVTQDHTFGQGTSPFEHVYVVNGPISAAGATEAAPNPFGPASDPFPPDVIAGIEDELVDLPPVRFVHDGNDVRLGEQGMQGVKDNGVIITLGRVAWKDGQVNVATGLWCGRLCGQWLTYVLVEDDGRWEITGTTGPISIS